MIRPQEGVFLSVILKHGGCVRSALLWWRHAIHMLIHKLVVEIDDHLDRLDYHWRLRDVVYFEKTFLTLCFFDLVNKLRERR